MTTRDPVRAAVLAERKAALDAINRERERCQVRSNDCALCAGLIRARVVIEETWAEADRKRKRGE